ncbi:hypothetical protein [Streptomyces sp. NPDC058457]|uniref:hypothetical protein n=1 Tax=Streptomyces sp. NPDC058457 TaxID=3346507 RepID=UPI0036512EA9
MSVTTTRSGADGATEVEVPHRDLPEGIRPQDDEPGMRTALDRPARLVEGPA